MLLETALLTIISLLDEYPNYPAGKAFIALLFRAYGRRSVVTSMAIRLSRTFVLRKLHQLSGIVPLGAFLLEHFYTNSKAVNPNTGVGDFNEAVATLQGIPYILLIEITVIFIPLIYHAVYALFTPWQ